MKTLVEDYDIVVVGAGHAGCEAALGRRAPGSENHYVYCQRRQYRFDAM